MNIQSITAKLEANNWQIACLTPEERALAATGGAMVASFRRHLNTQDHKHANGRYRQRARPYGDYLFTQDRDKFMMEMKAWMAAL